MTKEQMIALEQGADALAREGRVLSSRTLAASETDEMRFNRRVDAVWGNIATEEPQVTREDVARQLRDVASN